MSFFNFFLDTDQVAADVAREFLDCELEVNYNETELALYLAIEMEREELVSLGLGEVTHTRPHKTRSETPGEETWHQQNYLIQ